LTIHSITVIHRQLKEGMVMKNLEPDKTKKPNTKKETVWDDEMISREEMNNLNDTFEKKKVEFKL
jgi:hypothetical protein